MNARLNPSQIG